MSKMEATNRSQEEFFIKTKYPVYLIRSTWSVVGICELFDGYSTANGQYGPIKVEYEVDESGKVRSTNRALVIMKDGLIKKLSDNRYTDPSNRELYIDRYKYFNHPNPNFSLCIPIPKNLNLTGQDIRKIFESILSQFVTFGMLDKSKFSIEIPLLVRERDIPSLKSYINFENDVDPELIALIRSMIDKSLWNSYIEDDDFTDLYNMKCRYKRDFKEENKGKFNKVVGSKKPYYKKK